MNRGGAKKLVARLIEEGLDVAWLQSLQVGRQPSSKAGIGPGGLRQLHARGAIVKARKDGKGLCGWVAGPFLQDFISLAEQLGEVKH